MRRREALTIAENCSQLRRVCDIISRDLEVTWGCLKYGISDGVDEGTARLIADADEGELCEKFGKLCGLLQQSMGVAAIAKHWAMDLHSQEARDYFESLAEAADKEVEHA